MKLRYLLPRVAAVALLGPAWAWSAEFKVIANPSVKADGISANEIKSIFLEERNSLRDGTHVEPVLAQGGPAHQAFVKEYLGKSDDDLQNYYRALVFTGRGSMPKTLRSEDEVVAYVAKTRGAIGYVSSAVETDGVRKLSVYSAENEGSRKIMSRVEPEYPDILKTKHIGGTVRLEVTVAANGSVEDVRILGGNPMLADPAAAAVKQWAFAPGRGRTTIEISIPFDPDR